MNDELSCFLCFGSILVLAGFSWLAQAIAEARREARRASEAATQNMPAMARQLYEAIGALEQRVAHLEAQLSPQVEPTPSFAQPPTEPVPVPIPAHVPVPEPVPAHVNVNVNVPAAAYTTATTPAPEPTPAPAPSPSPAPSPAPAPAVDWEQWIGVRGAAAAGAIVLALAGVFFFRYSIEHGLISPTMRVVIGTLTGLACIAASELRLRHVHKPLSEYLAGAGFAILYLAFWASNAIFHLVPTSVTTLLMIAVTAASCTVAYVRHAVPVAALGLLGGFATPILLSTGQDRPITLFSYLLMLDLGLLVLARARAWVWLALAALVGTFLYQASWFGTQLDAPRMWLGVAIVVVFSVVFAWPSANAERTRDFRTTRILSVLAPALFAFFFGAQAKLGANFLPTATLLVMLTAGAAWFALVDGSSWVRTTAATLAIVTTGVHFFSVRETLETSFQSLGISLALLLVQAAANEFARRRASERAQTWDFDIVLFGALFYQLVLTLTERPASYVLHLGTLAAVFLVASAESVRSGQMARMLGASILLVFGAVFLHARHALSLGFPPESVYLGLVVGTAILTHLAPMARFRADHASTRLADHGAGFASFFLVLHLAIVPERAPISVVPYFATVFFLVLLACLVTVRRGHGGWLLATVLATNIAHLLEQARVDHDRFETLSLLVGLGLYALFVSVLPIVVGSRGRSDVSTWRAASLAGPTVFLPALFSWKKAVSHDTRGIVPLGFALVGIVTLLLARRLLAAENPVKRSALAWAAVASLSLVGIAIPVQLKNEWVTVGWAVQGALVLALYRRFDHAGIKRFALLLFTAAFIRLVLNVEVLRYHAPSGRPVFNWLAYTYLVPMACFVFASVTLARAELARRMRMGEEVPADFLPLPARLLGIGAIVLGFAWIVLTVIDAFAVGRTLEIPFEREPGRDLTMSLAWALYAIALLAVGLWKKSTGLRKASLALVLITCLKVFLYDLGKLEDLYRVASLVGLAFALIVISLAYKRLVFRDAPETR